MIGRALAVAAAVLATGCPQLLGLDDTRFEPTVDAEPDGPGSTDAPSVCDGAPACVATTGRSTCGQLMGTGDLAGLPLRAPSPTGAQCLPNGEGPCAFTLEGVDYAQLGVAGVPVSTPGSLDDCGRFVIPDMDPAIDVAVVVMAAGYLPTITVVNRAENAVGTDRDVVALAVTQATVDSWELQTGADPAPAMEEGYLFQLRAFGSGAPLPGVQIAEEDLTPFMQQPLAAIGTPPWAVYFGAKPFDVVDSGATDEGSRASGTAYAAVNRTPVRLDGQRVGRRCTARDLHGVAGVLQLVTLVDC